MRRICALSSVPGALKALWAAVTQVQPSHVHYNQLNLAMLLARSTCVHYTVIIERKDFLQNSHFWLQDEFLGAAAATFADSTGCQMKQIYAKLVQVSPYCETLIVHKVLRFDRQKNSHIIDTLEWPS